MIKAHEFIEFRVRVEREGLERKKRGDETKVTRMSRNGKSRSHH